MSLTDIIKIVTNSGILESFFIQPVEPSLIFGHWGQFCYQSLCYFALPFLLRRIHWYCNEMLSLGWYCWVCRHPVIMSWLTYPKDAALKNSTLTRTPAPRAPGTEALPTRRRPPTPPTWSAGRAGHRAPTTTTLLRGLPAMAMARGATTPATAPRLQGVFLMARPTAITLTGFKKLNRPWCKFNVALM